MQRATWIIVFAVLASSAQGALLDTVGALSRRYGPPVEVDKTNALYTFHWRQLRVVVNVVHRQSGCECYSHPDGSELTESEIRRFLALNAAESLWTEHRDPLVSTRQWTRADRKATAVYYRTPTPVLSVSTK